MFEKNFILENSLTLLLMFFILFGSLGMSHAGMSMNMDGNMTDCPFMLGVSLCSMSPIEIVSSAQSFMSNITLLQDSVTLLLLLSAIFVSVLFSRFFSPPKIFIRYNIYQKEKIIRYSFLREAFSNGLLNTKVFLMSK